METVSGTDREIGTAMSAGRVIAEKTFPGQRWHPDVWVDPAQVQPRINAALDVGGTLVSDAAAPSFWVLADPEGNRVCLCTWQERG